MSVGVVSKRPMNIYF